MRTRRPHSLSMDTATNTDSAETYTRAQFVEAAARTFMADAWASMIEASHSSDPDDAYMVGKFPDAPNFSGCNIFDLAPLERDGIDPAAYQAAIKLAGELQRSNMEPSTLPGSTSDIGGDIANMAARCAAHLGDAFDGDDWAHYVTMQAMGHGVCWYDDVDISEDGADAAVNIPNVEFSWCQLERSYDSAGNPE